MSEITFQQVLQLAEIQHPERLSLNAACQLTVRRTRLKNFLRWAIYLLTFTTIARAWIAPRARSRQQQSVL